MKTRCPHCSQRYEIDDEFNNQNVECSQCENGFTAKPIIDTISDLAVKKDERMKRGKLFAIIGIIIITIIVIIVSITRTDSTVTKDATQGTQIISGGFGFTLGESLSSEQLKIGEMSREYESYLPLRQPFRNFEKVKIFITPRAHKIYRIWASHIFDTYAEAIQEMDVLVDIFKSKYTGAKEFIDTDNNQWELHIQDLNGNTIKIMLDGPYRSSFSGHSRGGVFIEYISDELYLQAEKEREEIKQEEIKQELSKTDFSMI